MTPLSFQDPQLHKELAMAIYGWDKSEAIDVVKNKIIPHLQRQGIHFGFGTPSAGVKEYPKTPQNCEAPQLSKYTDHGIQDFTSPIKPFMMIDINAIKNKRYTPEEVFQIFEQTGVTIIRPTKNLTFGQATQAAKEGKRVRRAGWNGIGMYAYIVPARSYPAVTEVARKEFGDMVPYRSYWALKTAQGDVATWAPSGSDSLAEDWEILD